MIPDASCPPDPVCCESIYGKANDLLAVVQQALCDCCGPDECGKFQGFVGVGNEPQMGAIDYVAVWMVRVTAAPSSALAQNTMLLPRFRFQYAVKIHETGFPLLSPQADAPDPAAVDHASHVHLSRVEVVLRRVLNAMRTGGLVNAGSFQSFDGLTPRPRDAGGVAHVFEVTLEHDWLPAVTA